MISIIEHEVRANAGSSKWRGNCNGEVIRELYDFFKFKSISDYMVGSGTTKDMAEILGIKSNTYDLHSGFDLVEDEIKEKNDFIFFHPPYWNMIKYSGNMYDGVRKNDLSRINDYDEFISVLNLCVKKQFDSLKPGGRIAILVGDVKRKGKLYSIQRDMKVFGTLENIVIKKQFNCNSNYTNYGDARFIKIVHEYLLIYKKPFDRKVV